MRCTGGNKKRGEIVKGVMDALVDDLARTGTFDIGRARRVLRDAHAAFHLDEATQTRPQLLRYVLPLDDAFLKRAARSVGNSKVAGARVGHEWTPRTKNAIEPRDEDDSWVDRDDLRVLDDVCTKFCTNTFFPDAFARLNMILNVVRLYERLAAVGDLPFKIIFKGGVMLRLVLLQFWADQTTHHDAVDYLAAQNAISMGDFDFEIVPDAHHLSDDVKHRFVLLNYFVLTWLQRQMEEELEGKRPPGLLDLGWDAESARADLHRRLQAEIDEIDDVDHQLKGARVDAVFIGGAPSDPPKGHTTKNGRRVPKPRRNLFVFKCEDGETCVTDAKHVVEASGLTDYTSRGTRLYATCNTYIAEDDLNAPVQRAGQLRPMFHLSRIKHTFTLYYTTRDGKKRCDRLAGEMVDLSMGDPLDEIRAWKHKILGKESYRFYPIVGVPRSMVQLRSYSPHTFLLDHEQMLHLRETPPWEVPKYSKRVVRYAACLIVAVAELEDVDVSSKVRALRALVDYTGDAERVLRGRMRATGIEMIDHFALKEHECTADGARGKWRAYLKTVHTHLKTLVDLYANARAGATNPQCNTLDVTILDFLNRLYL